MLHPSHAPPYGRRVYTVQLGKDGQQRRLRWERKMELFGGGEGLKAKMLQASWKVLAA
jgi:hypothetical protein